MFHNSLVVLTSFKALFWIVGLMSLPVNLVACNSVNKGQKSKTIEIYRLLKLSLQLHAYKDPYGYIWREYYPENGDLHE